MVEILLNINIYDYYLMRANQIISIILQGFLIFLGFFMAFFALAHDAIFIGYGLIVTLSIVACFAIIYKQVKDISKILMNGLNTLETMISCKNFRSAFPLQKELERVITSVKKFFKIFLIIVPDLKWNIFRYNNILDSLVLESRKKFLDYIPKIQKLIETKDFKFILKQISIMEHNLIRIEEIGGHIDDIAKKLAEEKEWIGWALENTQAWLVEEVRDVGEMINDGEYRYAQEKLERIKDLAVKACLMKPTDRLRQLT
ncbi:MAG: hypothetical protein ACFFCS_11660 [Candidatus Hodarchaeota archaeon]